MRKVMLKHLILIVLCTLAIICNSFKANAQWGILGKPNNINTLNYAIGDFTIDTLGNIYIGGNSKNDSGKYYVAKWSGISWEELGGKNNSPFNNIISSIITDPTGNIYTTGYFTNAYGKNYVAKWNGTNWNQLGGSNDTTFNDKIKLLTSDKTGNIYATGSFKNSLGKYCVAKWNGTNWSKLGGVNDTTFNGSIEKIFADGFGNLYAAGYFKNSGGKYYVAKWNGTIWVELGGINTSPFTYSLQDAVMDVNGNIYVAGSLKNTNGKYYVAKWDGTNWSELGGTNTSTFNGNIFSLSVDDSNNVYVGGMFPYVEKWNGTNWGHLGLDSFKVGSVYKIFIDKYNNLYVNDYYYDGNNNYCLTKWNGTSKIELGYIPKYVFPNIIRAIKTDFSNNVYVTGDFGNTSGSNFYVSKWDGIIWSKIGGENNTFFNNMIYDIAVDKSGNIYAGGQFMNANSKRFIAKWNGTSWSELGGVNTSTFNFPIRSVAVDSLGNVYASGDFRNASGRPYVAKWNGTNWSELGGTNQSKFYGSISSVVIGIDGNIYAGGNLKNSNGKNYVAKWDGTSWSELGGSNSSTFNNLINKLFMDTSGNLFAAGFFSNTNGKNYVAKWDGINWNELGGTNSSTFNSGINALTTDSNGNVYAAGGITNSKGKYYVAKWNGASWSELGGTDSCTFNDQILAIANDAQGSLYAGGNFAITTQNGSLRYVGEYRAPSNYNIVGNVRTPLNKAVKKATLSCAGSIISNTILDSTGVYNINLNTGNYTIKPTKNNDITKANGVTSVDALLTQRHILNTTKLNSAYKLIAADVDGNKAINSVDVLRMKRLILGTDTTFTSSTKGNRLWEFVDSAYQFPDTTNPFPFKDSISFNNLTSNKINQTFIGVKLGDVNYDWNPLVAKGVEAKPVEFVYHVISTKEKSNQTDFSGTNPRNDEIRIPITVNNFKDIAAMQYTLHFDNSKYEFVTLEGFKNLEGFEYNAVQANTSGNISMLWTDRNAVERTLEDGTDLFTLVLRSTVDGRLSTDLALTNEITDIEAWDKDFIKHNIVLTKRETRNDKLETRKEVVIYPNPTKGLVKLNIETFAGKGNIIITDVYGKQVKTQALSIGTNTLDIAKLSKGIYFVSIITSEGKTTKKLVVE